MLQNIGDKLKSQRWLAAPLLGLLALIFAAWGAYGVVNISFGAPGLWSEGQRRARQHRHAESRLAGTTGAILAGAQRRCAAAERRSSSCRGSCSTNTCARRCCASAPRKTAIGPATQQVIEAYQSEPAFQVDGKFDPQAAETMLAQIGLTPAAYETERRQALQIVAADRRHPAFGFPDARPSSIASMHSRTSSAKCALRCCRRRTFASRQDRRGADQGVVRGPSERLYESGVGETAVRGAVIGLDRFAGRHQATGGSAGLVRQEQEPLLRRTRSAMHITS